MLMCARMILHYTKNLADFLYLLYYQICAIYSNAFTNYSNACLPADAKIVHIMAFFNAVILSSSWMIVLYDSSLYLEAASMNLRL